jgi:hypothetical protein
MKKEVRGLYRDRLGGVVQGSNLKKTLEGKKAGV